MDDVPNVKNVGLTLGSFVMMNDDDNNKKTKLLIVTGKSKWNYTFWSDSTEKWQEGLYVSCSSHSIMCNHLTFFLLK